MFRRENPYASHNPTVKDFFDKEVYAADVGQRRALKNAAKKGRELKIGHDHKLAQHLEKRIGRDGFSPDAAICEIQNQGVNLSSDAMHTKTVYNMIDRGNFLNLTNKDLPVKRNNKKRKYRNVQKMTLNNQRGPALKKGRQWSTIEKSLVTGRWFWLWGAGKPACC